MIFYYEENNRVKTIGIESIDDKNYEIVINNYLYLKDFITNYQIFEIKKLKRYSNLPSIIVEDIYKGNKFSDTCIAEIDYFFKKEGWLFGGLN